MSTYRSFLAWLVAATLSLVPAAFAAIGDAPSSILEDLSSYAPSVVEGGDYQAGAGFRFRVDAFDGVAIGVSGEGAMNDANVRLVADLIGVASGYGQGIAGPVAEFLRARAASFAGQGARVVRVEEYQLSLTVTGDAPYQLAFGFEPHELAGDLLPVATHSIGPADAEHVIREFSDFQCPFCERFASEALPSIKSELLAAGNVRFEFHHLPLKSIHPNAVVAAEAAECAAEAADPAAFWTMHDALFAQQSAWQGLSDPVDAFVQLAVDAGLDGSGLAACIRSGRHSDGVEAAYQVGTAVLGLTSTPSVFVDGLKVGDYTDVGAYRRLMTLSSALEGARLAAQDAGETTP